MNTRSLIALAVLAITGCAPQNQVEQTPPTSLVQPMRFVPASP